MEYLKYYYYHSHKYEHLLSSIKVYANLKKMQVRRAEFFFLVLGVHINKYT